MNKFWALVNAVVHGWAITKKLYVAFSMVKPGQVQVSVTHTVDLNADPKS